MANSVFFLRRVIDLFFPLRNSWRRLRLWNRLVAGKGSVCTETFFEGKNTIMKNTRVIGCRVGLGSYVADETCLVKTKVGRFCSIADHVRTGFGTHPTRDFVTTFPAFYYETANLGFSFYCGGG